MKWEYLFLYWDNQSETWIQVIGNDREPLREGYLKSELFNDLGRQRWELIQVSPIDYNQRFPDEQEFIFKRLLMEQFREYPHG